MTITRLNPGARYNGVVIHNNTVYLAGQVAKTTVGQSVANQTTEVLGLIDIALASAGITKSKLLSVNVFLSDISTFAEMNTAYDKWVDKAHMPVRVTVEGKIANPLETVEIFGVAALD